MNSDRYFRRMEEEHALELAERMGFTERARLLLIAVGLAIAFMFVVAVAFEIETAITSQGRQAYDRRPIHPTP